VSGTVTQLEIGGLGSTCLLDTGATDFDAVCLKKQY